MQPPEGRQAVIYTRVSRDQAGGRSVADQERECRQTCDAHGWEVRQVFSDNSIGASRHSVGDRAQWKKLKKSLRAGDVLVCWESSRTGRDIEEFVALRNLCASLQVPLSYSGRLLDLTLGDDRFVGGLDALLAERESEQIRTRVLRGKRAAAADGLPYGRAPWGYHAPTPRVWEPDPVESVRVKQAAESILAGGSLRQVLAQLQSDGHAPRDITALRRALSNPALAGLRVHQGAVVGKGNWPPIISEEQHLKLVGRFEKLSTLQTVGRKPKHLLSGIAECSVCGNKLRHRAYKDRNPNYTCPAGHVSRLAEMLDEEVQRRLFQRLSTIDPAEHEPKDADDDAVLDEIVALEKKLEEWVEAAIEGTVNPGHFAKIEKGLQGRISALKAKLGAAPALGLDARNIAKNWDKIDTEQKRMIIRAFMTIKVRPLGRVRALPTDVDITPI